MKKLNNEEKKELKEAYKHRKPDMGIFSFTFRGSGNGYLFTAREIKSLINKLLFTLDMGSCTEKKLQKEWNTEGRDNLEITVLEKLEVKEENPENDYQEDLAILRLDWEEKLLRQGVFVVNQSPE